MFVPQADGQAQVLPAITNAQQAVIAPAEGSAAGMVMRKIVPGGAGRAVVLAHRTPGPLAEVRPPQLPVHIARAMIEQALVLGGGWHGHERSSRHIGSLHSILGAAFSPNEAAPPASLTARLHLPLLFLSSYRAWSP